VVLDLCCGSGALGAAVAATVHGIELHASDLDPAAAACARANLAGLAAGVYQGDLYEPLPARLRGRVDVLIAHVPYVPTAEIAFLPAEARLHEPLVALDGGADGLDVARRVVQGAPTWLAAGGSVLFETSDRQQAEAVTVVRAAGLLPRVARSDELGATVVLGLSRPAADPPGQAAAP
jgi:release factor glutamine methyltransferase